MGNNFSQSAYLKKKNTNSVISRQQVYTGYLIPSKIEYVMNFEIGFLINL